MNKPLLFISLFLAAWTLTMLAPLSGRTAGSNGGGGCSVDINQCGNVSSTLVSNNNGCVLIDDGNHDDPPYPGILTFDNDKDDGKIETQCPGLAGAPGAPQPTSPPLPPSVNAQSCTKSPPSTWYDADAPVNSTATSWAAPNEGTMIIRDAPINATAPSWLAPAQNFASGIFKILFIFEIFMIGLQAILHRDNLAHLFSGFTFKTFVVTFFIYLMSNAATIFPAVFNSFKIAGQGMGTTNATNLMDIYNQADQSSELFFCAAMASHIDDRLSALEFGSFTTQSANVSAVFNGAIGHITFEFIVQVLGMLVIAAAGIMFLSLALITAESYIAMFAGALFLGFSPLRFTLPYTQGYLRYTLGVGAKMFTYWLLIAMENGTFMPILKGAGTNLINAASIQFGEQPGQGQEPYLLPATMDVVQLLALSALTWFLPAILGRYISGSNTSAGKIISGLASSLKESRATGFAAGPVALAAAGGPLIPPTLAGVARAPAAAMAAQTTVVAPKAAPLIMRGTLGGVADESTAAASYTAAAASNAMFAETPLKAKNAANSTSAPPEVVQVSISDGPDPFAQNPKIAPLTISLPIAAAQLPTEHRQKTPETQTPLDARPPEEPRDHHAEPTTGEKTIESPGFGKNLLQRKTPPPA